MRDFPTDPNDWLGMLLGCGLLLTLPYAAIASLGDWLGWWEFW